MEQISLVIRYFFEGEIHESFLEFRAAFAPNAEALTTAILDVLQSYGIDYRENLLVKAMTAPL